MKNPTLKDIADLLNKMIRQMEKPEPVIKPRWFAGLPFLAFLAKAKIF